LLVGLLALLAVGAAASGMLGAERKTSSARRKPQQQRRLKPGEYNPSHATVELFAAIEAGDIEVKFIPKDDTQANVIIKNKTRQPLNVQLPQAFAAVPVLAQMGMGGMGGMGGGGMQGMGGGMGGMGMGMGGMGMGGMGGMGGGFFNVAAEKVGKFKVACVCLEHGKADPRPSAEYRMVPIAEFTQEPGVAEVCEMLGYGLIDRRAAQAAVWHLNNGMSWDELAAKEIKRADGSRYPYFAPEEIRLAMTIAAEALSRHEEKLREQPGEGRESKGKNLTASAQ
jgi:hypothetical protein